MDWVFLAVLVSDPIDFVKKKKEKKKNWLKMIDPGAYVDGFSLTWAVILSCPCDMAARFRTVQSLFCGIAKP